MEKNSNPRKSIVITGASKGIGKDLALKLASEGHRLAVVARDADALNDIQKIITATGGQCLIFSGSVADEALCKTIIRQAAAEFGGVDVLVNNAGFGIFKKAEELTSDEWSSVYDTNVKGTFLYSREAVKIMKNQGHGHIINIASDVARRVFDGGSLYCSSKYAQDAFSMALRKEVRQFGIKVSVIYSGLVDTMFHREPQGDPSHSSWLKSEDMASVISYVMSQPAHVVIDELMVHPLSQEY